MEAGRLLRTPSPVSTKLDVWNAVGTCHATIRAMRDGVGPAEKQAAVVNLVGVVIEGSSRMQGRLLGIDSKAWRGSWGGICIAHVVIKSGP